MSGKCAAFKPDMAALRADNDAYTDNGAKKQEASHQESKGKQLEIAFIKESSTKRHVENRSLVV